MDSGQKKVDFRDASREEVVAFLDNCCGPELAQGAAADTAEVQAKVQAIRGSWKYRSAGLSYTAASLGCGGDAAAVRGGVVPP